MIHCEIVGLKCTMKDYFKFSKWTRFVLKFANQEGSIVHLYMLKLDILTTRGEKWQWIIRLSLLILKKKKWLWKYPHPTKNEIDVENFQIYITYRSTNVILVTEENMDVKVDLSNIIMLAD
jgi:hypothetical protein